MTGTGRDQARAVGKMLRHELARRSVFKVFSSPQGRALTTAQIAMESLGHPIIEDDRLREIAFGEWEGLTRDEIDAGWPEQAKHAELNPFEWHMMSPGGERLSDVQNRAESFLSDLDVPAVIFTHGILSRVLRATWLGQDEYVMSELPGGQGVIFHLHPEHGHKTIQK